MSTAAERIVARNEQLEKKANALLLALRQAWKLVHPGDREFAPEAVKLIDKYGA